MTPGPYLHLGGDEALGTDPEDFARVHRARDAQIVADLGKTPIAWHEAGAAAGIAARHGRAVLGLHDPDRRHGREGARVRAQRRAADPLARRRDLPRHEVRRGRAARPDVGERPDERRARVLVGARRAIVAGHRRRRHPRRRGAAVDRDDPHARRHRRDGVPAHRRGRRERRGRPRPAPATCAPGTSFRERVGALGPLWTSLGIGFHPSAEIPWATESTRTP